MFRYVEKLRGDASALEHLSIAAERGHAGARYEWSKMILAGCYPDEQRIQAARYILELIQYGYRQCGTERLTDYLLLVVPIAEKELVKQRDETDENVLYLMTDLSIAYELMERKGDANLLMCQAAEHFERFRDHFSESMLTLARQIDGNLVKQRRWDLAARLRAIVRDCPFKMLLAKHQDDYKELLKQLEKLDETYADQNRYGDQIAVREKLWRLTRERWKHVENKRIVSRASLEPPWAIWRIAIG